MGSVVVDDPVKWKINRRYDWKSEKTDCVVVSGDGSVSRSPIVDGYAFHTHDRTVPINGGAVLIDGRVDRVTSENWNYSSRNDGCTSNWRFVGLLPSDNAGSEIDREYASRCGSKMPGYKVFSGTGNQIPSRATRYPVLLGITREYPVDPPHVGATGIKTTATIWSSSLEFDSAVVGKLADGKIVHVGTGTQKSRGSGKWYREDLKYNYAGTPSTSGPDAGSYSVAIPGRGSFDSGVPSYSYLHGPYAGSFCSAPEVKLNKLVGDNVSGAQYAIDNKAKHSEGVHVVVYAQNMTSIVSSAYFQMPKDHWIGNQFDVCRDTRPCFHYIDNNSVRVAVGLGPTSQQYQVNVFELVLDLQSMTIVRNVYAEGTAQYSAILSSYNNPSLEHAIVDIGNSESVLFKNNGVFKFERSSASTGPSMAGGLLRIGDVSGLNNVYPEVSCSQLVSAGTDRYIVWNSCQIRPQTPGVMPSDYNWGSGTIGRNYDLKTIPAAQRGRHMNTGDIRNHALHNRSVVNVFDLSAIKSVKDGATGIIISNPNAYYVIPDDHRLPTIWQENDTKRYWKFFGITIDIQQSGSYVFGSPSWGLDSTGVGGGQPLGRYFRIYKYQDYGNSGIVKRVCPGDGFSDRHLCLPRIAMYLDAGKYYLVVTGYEKFGFAQDMGAAPSRLLYDEIDIENPIDDRPDVHSTYNGVFHETNLNAMPNLGILEFGRVRT